MTIAIIPCHRNYFRISRHESYQSKVHTRDLSQVCFRYAMEPTFFIEQTPTHKFCKLKVHKLASLQILLKVNMRVNSIFWDNYMFDAILFRLDSGKRLSTIWLTHVFCVFFFPNNSAR